MKADGYLSREDALDEARMLRRAAQLMEHGGPMGMCVATALARVEYASPFDLSSVEHTRWYHVARAAHVRLRALYEVDAGAYYAEHPEDASYGTDRAYWAGLRLHPGNHGARILALLFAALVAEDGGL